MVALFTHRESWLSAIFILSECFVLFCWVHVVAGQMLMSTVLPAIGFVWWQDRVLPKVESLWWQDKRSGIIEPFQWYQTDFIRTRCCHCSLVDGIAVKHKMVIVIVRLVKGHQLPLTMTQCCATILDCCIAQLKKWQVSHQVPRCWPHPTTCRSPGHGILGRPGLMVTCVGQGLS